MGTQTPAVHTCRQARAGGVAEIYACAAHMFRTIKELRDGDDAPVQVLKADPTVHGCKGCLEDW